MLSLPFSSNSINEGYFTINFKIKRQDFVLRDLVKEKMLNIKICLHKIWIWRKTNSKNGFNKLTKEHTLYLHEQGLQQVIISTGLI